MRTTAALLGFLALGASLPPADAIACGDKFLVIGRSAKRVQKARHPARVALFLRAGSPMPAEASAMRLEKTLRQAGHDVQAVADETALHAALASRRLDFVIADLGDATGIARVLSGADAPQIVPLTRGDAAPPVEYALVIRSGKSLSYLGALDAAMGKRSAASPR